MGKKGAKRKTRWRTLSIGTPPGEEDEEDDKGHKDGHNSSREHHPRNGYMAWHKARHGSAGSSGSNGANGNGGSTTSGYASSRSRRGDDYGSSESPTMQHNHRTNHGHNQRIMFNEEEYTRITTPRQDMLFKKGYLAQRKPWIATTSNTPSTNESQSASHSTADGSEAAEDQQLLDGCATGEYVATVPVLDPNTGAAYHTTYYDHATGGYYYAEYPAMMLVTPTMPHEQTPLLAAMPCTPVPLRPIEWVNPAYVPKLASQQYCYMDYQTTHNSDCAALVDAQGLPLTMVESVVAAPLTNGMNDKTNVTDDSATVVNGSISSNSPIVSEEYHSQEQPETQQYDLKSEPEFLQQQEVRQVVEPVQGFVQEQTVLQESVVVQEPQLQAQETLQPVTELEPVVEYAEVPYVETLPPQPMHQVAHHVVPQQCAQQTYVYPGQYMFGSSVVNVNGMTVQNGPMLRCSDMLTSAGGVVVTKRRRKKCTKKKRKQKRPIALVSFPMYLGNVEDEDEEDYYSSEENSLSSPRVTWSSPPSSSSTRLNPECQEFCLPSAVVKSTTLSEASVSSPEFYPNSYTASAYMSLPVETNVADAVKKSELRYDESTVEFVPKASKAINIIQNHMDNEAKRLKDEEPQKDTTPKSNNHLDFHSKNDEQTDIHSKNLTNGNLSNHTDYKNSNGCSVNSDQENEKVSGNTIARLPNGETPCIKYNGKVQKIMCESMSELDLDKKLNVTENSTKTCSKDDLRSIENVTSMLSATSLIEAEVSLKGVDSDNCQTWLNESSITSESCYCETSDTTKSTPAKRPSPPKEVHEVNDEDSGFESQSKDSGLIVERPIAEAVNEWLKRVNSPDLFISISDLDDDDEEDASVSNEPSKNLQSNPMPALSVNGEEASRSKFASSVIGASNKKDDESKTMVMKNKSKKNRNKGAKRKGGAKGRNKSNNKNDRSSSNSQQNNAEDHTVSVQSGPSSGKKVDEACELTEKDSDAGMRVAEKSRIQKQKAVANNSEHGDHHDTISRKEIEEEKEEIQISLSRRVDDIQPVKTYEKGEIVISMDGELLLVQECCRPAIATTMTTTTVTTTLTTTTTTNSKTTERRMSSNSMTTTFKRRESNSSTTTNDDKRSLGSIEEPDVLDCWEVETVEPLVVVSPKKLLEPSDEKVSTGHVHKYYRLEVDSTPASTEINPKSSKVDDNASIASNESAVISISMPGQDDLYSNVPVEEAFDAYESCYTARPLPLAFAEAVNPGLVLPGRQSTVQSDESPIRCKAVCCAIQ